MNKNNTSSTKFGENIIREMRIEDLDKVVDIHLCAFPGFFLSFLGPRFLRLLYRGIIFYDAGIALIYDQDGKVVGFVAGAIAPSKLYKHLIRTHFFGFAWAALDAVLRNPLIIPRLLRAFLYPNKTSRLQNTATLMSIAVDPRIQGSGIGQQLVNAFLEKASQQGVNRVDLTTDRLNNDVVNSFYCKMGFSCQRVFTTPEGRQMNEYIIALRESTSEV